MIKKMFTWNDPYVLAAILGLIAVAVFHFDQKKKENEVESISYIKVFVLVAGSIFLFNYFVLPSVSSLTSSVSLDSEVTSSAVTATSTVASASVGSPQSPVVGVKQLQTPNSAFTPILNTMSSTLGGLKIKEGPPNF